MKRTILEKDGEKKVAWVEKIAGQLWLHMDGQTWTYAPEAKKRKATSSDGLDGDIESPMPGKILKVHVKQDQKVKESEELVVLEAMKMEYSLKAPFDGKVNKVLASKGQQVGAGELLVSVEGLEGNT